MVPGANRSKHHHVVTRVEMLWNRWKIDSDVILVSRSIGAMREQRVCRRTDDHLERHRSHVTIHFVHKGEVVNVPFYSLELLETWHCVCLEEVH